MLPERKLKPNKPSMQCSLPLVMITFFQLVVINPIFTWNRCKSLLKAQTYGTALFYDNVGEIKDFENLLLA